MSTTDQTSSRADKLADDRYADYMGHLYGCPPCQEENYCRVGTRMRAAWKGAQAAADQAYRARRQRRPAVPS